CGGGIRISHVSVTDPLEVGDSAWLECDVDRNGDSVYAIKWYLGLHEFYRWTPADSPPLKIFPKKGINVDEAHSKEGRVRLHNVTMMMAYKKFRCEVSGEAPSFHTDSRVTTTTVIDPPDSKPIISNIRPSMEYNSYDEIVLNCSSLRSFPKADLNFYINNEKADPNWMVLYPTSIERNTDLETSVVGLRFILRPHLFTQGYIKIKCTASILELYYSSTEKVIYNADNSFKALMMEGRASGNSEKNTVIQQTFLMTVLVVLLIY
ncbi:unnamed protein product, partial [Meganyctiphanes norvegica]